MPPAKFVFDHDDRRGLAIDSMVSGGCVISGSLVKRSLLFSNVRIHSYAEIIDSVILPDVEIGRNARITKAIIDSGCKIDEGMVIGEDHEQDKQRGFRVTEKGVVLVTPDMLHQTIHMRR
jgi:glucose-1-phosphate adenylyltransferase